MNPGTFLVLIVLAAVVALIIYGMRKDKRAGKCSGGCSSCAGCSACRKAKKGKSNQ